MQLQMHEMELSALATAHELGRQDVLMQVVSNPGAVGHLERLVWRKSKCSNPSGNCVQLARLRGGEVAIRNSRHEDGPVLVYTRAEMAAFLDGAKDGEFDDLVN